MKKGKLRKDKYYNYRILPHRIEDMHNTEAYEEFEKLIANIEGNVYITGTGGSYIPALFLDRYLTDETEVFSSVMRATDIVKRNLSNIDYVIAFSYGGYTPTIKKLMEQCNSVKGLKKVLITRGTDKFKERYGFSDEDILISYFSQEEKEKSFVPMSPIFSPMSLILRKHLGMETEDFIELIYKLYDYSHDSIQDVCSKLDFKNIFENKNQIVEIVSEYKTKTASKLLELLISESGMLYPIIHEKHEYSHGKYGTNYNLETPLMVQIVDDEDSNYQKSLTKYLKKNYNNVINITNEKDDLTGEFITSLKMLSLSMEIANDLGYSLSYVKHSKDLDARELYMDNLE